MRLTDIAIRQLKPPEKGQKTHMDDAMPNFGVRVSQGGTKTFIVMAGQTRQRITIGRFPVITIAEARTEAKRLLAERTLGKHRPKTVTFAEARERFLDHAKAKNRPRTVKDYTRLLKHFPFARTRLADISRHDIARQLDTLTGTPSERDHALVTIKVFFNWTVSEGYLDHSPCQGLRQKRPYRPRERILSPDELRAVWKASEAVKGHFGTITRLLILTGQRRSEIASLQWEWIEGDTITLPSELTKNRRTTVFPFGELTATLLSTIPRLEGSPYLFPASRQRTDATTVFNGWGKPKALLDNQSGVTGWTLHDLRRTYSSTMAYLGIPQILVEKLLNHVSGGTQSPISRVYNVYEYLDEMREAVSTYEGHLKKIMG
ncbi:MAG: tyrosine-type recombinase/integrase, partial [Lentilitoribacter sp.]